VSSTFAESLVSRRCIPCRGDTPPLTAAEREALLPQLIGWEVVHEHHLTKDYRFTNFLDALAFANRVGALAEQEGHHPEITISWGLARIRVWTHAIDGLSESDFVLAAKCDQVLNA